MAGGVKITIRAEVDSAPVYYGGYKGVSLVNPETHGDPEVLIREGDDVEDILFVNVTKIATLSVKPA